MKYIAVMDATSRQVSFQRLVEQIDHQFLRKNPIPILHTLQQAVLATAVTPWFTQTTIQ